MQSTVMIVGASSKTAESLARLLSMETQCRLIAISREETLTGFPTTATRYVLDFTDRKALKEACLKENPDFIVNTAAITNVDLCEDNRQLAWTVNVRGVENLIQMCRITDAHLIQLSSDYVFDGIAGPYTETDTPNPICYYGKTKLASENACVRGNINHTIVRTNVLYGATQHLKPDFVQWVLKQCASGKEFRVVNDQYNNPTLIDDLALAIKQIIEKKRIGYYNVGGADWMSRLEFARQIASVFNLDASKIGAMSTAELHQKAPRPLKGGLVTLKAETALNMRMSSVSSGLMTVRRQLQMFGYQEWKS